MCACSFSRIFCSRDPSMRSLFFSRSISREEKKKISYKLFKFMYLMAVC